MKRAAPRRAAATATMAVAAMLMGATLVSAGHFGDVNPNSVHAPGIEYVADAGITEGCRPGEFCPRDNLTRDQMATFIHRMSGNAPGIDPSVNAHRLEGFSAAELMAGGEQGPQGEQGDPGEQGPPGVSGYEVVFVEEQATNEQFKPATATCPAGKKVVGGGGDAGPAGQIVVPGWEDTFPWVLTQSRPVGDNAWRVGFRNLMGPGDARVWARAVCAVVE